MSRPDMLWATLAASAAFFALSGAVTFAPNDVRFAIGSSLPNVRFCKVLNLKFSEVFGGVCGASNVNKSQHLTASAPAVHFNILQHQDRPAKRFTTLASAFISECAALPLA